MMATPADWISLLVMLVSAKSKSTVLAVMIPFVLIFIPSFPGNIESSVINKISGLLPDRMLQINIALGYFVVSCYLSGISAHANLLVKGIFNGQ